jgi:hypothetical protein
MSQQNKAQDIRKRLEKRLTLENLETRSLLSASPLNVDAVLVEASTFTTDSDLQVDFDSVALKEGEGEGEGQGEGDQQQDQEQNNAEPIKATVDGKKLEIKVKAEAKQKITIAVLGSDGSQSFKTVTAKKLDAEGYYTYKFTGKEGVDYTITAINDKFTKKEYASAGQFPADRILGETNVSTLQTLTLYAKPGAATKDSISLLLKPGCTITNVEGLKFQAKFDGAKKAAEYTVQTNQETGELQLVNGDSAFGFVYDKYLGEMTIYGLKNANAKNTIQVAQTSADGISAYSKKVTVSTAKENQKAPAIDIHADFDPEGAAVVVFEVDAAQKDDTFTVAGYYFDANGKLKSKTFEKKVKVTEHTVDDGENVFVYYAGEVTPTKLASGTKYTFTVTNNKTKEAAASVSLSSNPLVTPATTPAAKLKKVGVTDTTATLQITNWNKMSNYLEQIDGMPNSGTIVVKNGETTLATFVYTEGVDEQGNPSKEWIVQEDGNLSTLTIVAGKKAGQEKAEIKLAGLTEATAYQFTVTTKNDAINENVNTVAEATSKALKVKTAIKAYDAVTNINAKEVTDSTMTVTWTQDKAAKFKVTATPVNGGKTVTKTVKGTEATLKGLKANTEYKVTVVAKADKNGSQSEEASENIKTKEKLEIVSIDKADGANEFAINFGVDMSTASGRLDFDVSGSGKVKYNGKTYGDSLKKTTAHVFFGADAQTLADAYQAANPDATCLILTDGDTTANLNVELKKYGQYVNGLFFTWKFATGAEASNLSFTFDNTYQYKVNGKVKLTGGEITKVNQETGEAENMTLKKGKTLKVSYSNL